MSKKLVKPITIAIEPTTVAFTYLDTQTRWLWVQFPFGGINYFNFFRSSKAAYGVEFCHST